MLTQNVVLIAKCNNNRCKGNSLDAKFNADAKYNDTAAKCSKLQAFIVS